VARALQARRHQRLPCRGLQQQPDKDLINIGTRELSGQSLDFFNRHNAQRGGKHQQVEVTQLTYRRRSLFPHFLHSRRQQAHPVFVIEVRARAYPRGILVVEQRFLRHQVACGRDLDDEII
jgi:hypothetical protein